MKPRSKPQLPINQLTVTLSPSQLLALHAGAVEVGGICGGDGGVRRSLVVRGLARYQDDGQTVQITDAGVQLIAGDTPFELKGDSTCDGTNDSAQILAIQIRGRTLKLEN